jgi:hypothetical protein
MEKIIELIEAKLKEEHQAFQLLNLVACKADTEYEQAHQAAIATKQKADEKLKYIKELEAELRTLQLPAEK